MSKRNIKPIHRFRRYVMAIGVTAFFVGLLFGAIYLIMREDTPEYVKKILIGAVATLAVSGIISIFDYYLLERREQKRRIEEDEARLRDELLRPARRPVTKADIGGGQYKEDGSGSMPSDPVDLGDMGDTFD